MTNEVQPSLFITGEGRIGSQAARKLGTIVQSAAQMHTLGGLVFPNGNAQVTDSFKDKLDASNSRSEVIMIHVISYDRDNRQIILDQVGHAKSQFPEVLHWAMVVKGVDPLSRIYFKQTEANPPTNLDVPYTIIEQGKPLPTRTGEEVEAEEIAFYGLAGLYKGHIAFPELNPHTARAILEALLNQADLIGIGVSADRQYVREPRFRLPGIKQDPSGPFIDLAQFKTGVDLAIKRAISEEGSITPFKPLTEPAIDVLAIQMPVNPKSKYWKDKAFMSRFNQIGQDYQREENSSIVVVSPVAIPTREKSWAVTSVAHFYPAASELI